MNELDAALAQATTGLVELSRQVGPDVAEAVLKAVRLGGLFDILGCLLVLAVTTPVLLRVAKTRRKTADFKSDLDNNIVVPVAIVVGLAAGTLFVVALFAIALPTKWVSVVDPAAGLAWRLLEKL